MSAAARFTPGRAGRVMVALTTVGAAAVVLGHAAAPASPHPVAAQVTLHLEPHPAGGDIPAHFVGLSLEWTLVERYLGDNARPAFANLLRNLGTGVLRVGGSSQDLLPFEHRGRHAITPADLADIRSTLDLANTRSSWSVILGTAMNPRSAGTGNLRRFLHDGVARAFSGAAGDIAGIELGNEVDVSYAGDRDRYLRDFAASARLAAPFGIVGPSTSEVIAPWSRIASRTVPTRFFWQWQPLLNAMAPALRAGGFASDHFYPVARGCAHDPYRCASVTRLLSDERRENFRRQVSAHARIAAAHHLGYRLAELNSAANRGVHGVSDVAASAVWALGAMFDAACPDTGCHSGAIGVNFHNAEVNRFGAAAEGNAYYNAIRFDPTKAMGAPTAAPEYYALLLFARFAQGTHGLRPIATSRLGAWQVDAPAGRRLFLVNRGDRPVTVAVPTSASSYEIDRMTPSRGGLHARSMRIDGRAVAPDGTWAGFRPVTVPTSGGRFDVTVGPAEAAVITLHGSVGA